MIEIHRMVFNSFQVNTYIVSDETGECIIIDPACYGEEEEKRLQYFISERNLTPRLHINTHCHIDHVLGMEFVRKHYGIQSMAHKEEQKLLKNAHLMGELFGFKTDPFPTLDATVAHHQKIGFGNSSLFALAVPGHSPGSIAFYSEDSRFVVTGDALFAGSIGRTDLPGGNYDTLIASIKEKLFTLPGETVIYPGHGGHSSIASEVESNPFFR